MSVTRDKNTGKWMSQIRVKDWTGKEIHKKKRGFKTKKEALQWERDFISQADGSLGMKFKDFVALYMKDADPRLRETTLANKHYLFDKKVLPYFGEMPINAIKPTDIRNWQNERFTTAVPTANVIRRPICEPSTTSSPQPSTLQ